MIDENFGKYKIPRLKGEDGMPSVYNAKHEMLGTKATIKVFNPILSTKIQKEKQKSQICNAFIRFV